MKLIFTIEIDTDPTESEFVQKQTAKLAATTKALADAVAAATFPPPHFSKGFTMPKAAATDPNPVLDALAAQITANASVVDSAVQFIGGVKGMIDAAVLAALNGGATAAQLAPFTDLSAAMAAKDQALAAAIAANTPTPPPVTPPSP